MRRLSWILAPVLAGLGILTLGIPGAIVFEVVMGVLELLSGRSLQARIPPDSAWPIAIYISLLWPLSLPLAAHLAASRRTRRGRVFIYSLTIGVVCTVLAVLFYNSAL